MLVVFTGQASQKANMYQLCEKYDDFDSYLNEIENITNRDVKYLLKEAGLEELKKTENAQLSLFAVEYFLGKKFLLDNNPNFLAGHSLGQYVAIALSGILSFEDCLRFIISRSKLMSEVQGSMLALLGSTLQEAVLIANLTSDKSDICYVANMNSSNQIILSGTSEAIQKAFEVAKLFSKKSIILATSGPFHTPYMNEAAEALEAIVDSFNFHDPAIPVISNVFAKSNIDWNLEIKLHIKSCVRWEESLKYASLDNKNLKICEIGPSAVLCNMAKKDGYDAFHYSEI